MNMEWKWEDWRWFWWFEILVALWRKKKREIRRWTTFSSW